MVNYRKAGIIVGYGVGEPWNAVAAQARHAVWVREPVDLTMERMGSS